MKFESLEKSFTAIKEEGQAIRQNNEVQLEQAIGKLDGFSLHLKSSQDHVISLKKENLELKEDVERLSKLANGVQMLEEDFAILET